MGFTRAIQPAGAGWDPPPRVQLAWACTVWLLHEQFEAFEITLLSPFWAGVDPALVDQNVDRVEPGNFALEFIVMSLHELIQFLDRDTFGMLTHQAENQLDGTILLGEFSTVRHDCSFCLRFSRVTCDGGHVA
jgi:hypothetical protein